MLGFILEGFAENIWYFILGTGLLSLSVAVLINHQKIKKLEARLVK